MLKVTIFKYAENKLIRTMKLGGEPWFVLRDVCEVLSLSTPAKVAERLDMDEVSQAHITDSMGRPQETTIINESGLYNVILRSDKPEAKPFRKWVTAVVLPSIRKNGGYIAGQEELSPQELMAKALLVAQKDTQPADGEKKTNTDSANDFGELLRVVRVGDRLNMDGLETMSVKDAKKAVLGKLKPTLHLDGKSAAYINAAFDMAVSERKDTNYQRRQMMHGDGVAPAKQTSSASEARQRMIDRCMNKEGK